MPSIVEKYEVKAGELLAILAEGKTDDPNVIDLDKITRLSGSKKDKAEEIKRRQTEVEMLGYQTDAYNAQKIAQEAKARAQNPTDGSDMFAQKGEEASAADLYLKSAPYKSEGHGFGQMVELKVDAKSWVHGFEQKTIMTTAAGWATRPARISELTEIATRPLQVTDLIPSSNTDASAILFMEETTRTNAAIEIGEGVAYPEAASGVHRADQPGSEDRCHPPGDRRAARRRPAGAARSSTTCSRSWSASVSTSKSSTATARRRT